MSFHFAYPPLISNGNCKSLEIGYHMIFRGDGNFVKEPEGFFQWLVNMPGGHEDIVCLSHLPRSLHETPVEGVMYLAAAISPRTEIGETSIHKGPKQLYKGFLFDVRDIPSQE